MALRNIRTEEDEILRKKSRKVEIIDNRTKILIQDMKETMYNANGVGLAAPQVGVLKRIIVVDVGEGPIVLINPEIIEEKGKETEVEGCLSVPGKEGSVERPYFVKIKGINEDGIDVSHSGEGLLARAFCHETDHLNGILFIDKATDIKEI
jgi:peptide deformylase